MSFASRYNRGKQFTIDTTGFQYFSLKELLEKNGKDIAYRLTAIYINKKGNYEDAPVFATEKYFVNVPAHMTDLCKEILADKEAVDDINKGKVGFKIYSYESEKYKKECYSVDFIDF